MMWRSVGEVKADSHVDLLTEYLPAIKKIRLRTLDVNYRKIMLCM